MSVLESSSSSTSSSFSNSGEKTLPPSPCHRVPQRARTKRPRPTTFNPLPVFVASENFAVSHEEDSDETDCCTRTEKEKEDQIHYSSSSGRDKSEPGGTTIRWKMPALRDNKDSSREGRSNGTKNSCGVHYKSGRLFPEYRPAASPTFVPSIHSNSHKKVLEMRTNVTPDNNAIARNPSPATTTQPEFNPSNNESVEEEHK